MTLYRQIGEPVAELDRSLALIQSGQGSAGQLFRDTAQYQQLRTTAQDSSALPDGASFGGVPAV